MGPRGRIEGGALFIRRARGRPAHDRNRRLATVLDQRAFAGRVRRTDERRAIPGVDAQRENQQAPRRPRGRRAVRRRKRGGKTPCLKPTGEEKRPSFGRLTSRFTLSARSFLLGFSQDRSSIFTSRSSSLRYNSSISQSIQRPPSWRVFASPASINYCSWPTRKATPCTPAMW